MGFPVNNPFDLRQIATPSAPAAGTTTLYSKTDSRIWSRVTSGYEILLMSSLTATYTSDAAPTPYGFVNKSLMVVIAQAVTATVGAPLGTAVDGASIIMRIKDNGSAQTLNWNAIYRAIDTVNMPLPTTTIAGKWLYLGFQYNTTDSKWDLIAVVNQT